MPTLRNYDIFISHAWKYNNEYYRLEDLLKEYPNFKFRNYSVPEHDPLSFLTKADLANQLEEQVRQSSVVLIIGGKYINYREWIKKEIDFAKKYNKPILLIRPYGANIIPTLPDVEADKVVSWNSSSIVTAIRELVTK